MNGDRLVERAANRLEQRAARLAERNGVRAKLAAELEADADFLRRLKPSLVRARLRESPPAAGDGDAGGPRERLEPEPPSRGGGARQALLVVGVSFAAGILLARLLDWRGHAHPQD